MEIRATQKYIRMSPRKIRLVVSMIKDLSPEEALERLPFTKKRGADPLAKVIKSALGNAREQGVDTEKLTFKNIQVGKGPSLKRWRPGARGRVKPYEKKMSQIKIVLEEKMDTSQKENEKATKGKEKGAQKKDSKKTKSDKKSTGKNSKNAKKKTKKTKKTKKSKEKRSKK